MDQQDKNMEIATFRFGVISDFVTGVKLEYGEKSKILKEKSERSYEIPFSKNIHISKSTILAWVKDYRDAGYKIEGLIPKQRGDKGVFKTLNPTLRMAIKEIKKDKPYVTVPTLVKLMKQKKLIEHDENINPSTIYRFLKQEQLGRLNHQAEDRRAFEADFANELWQSDVMHGPRVLINGINKKSYLCAIMDDHSRLILHAEFYAHENLSTFKICLKSAIEKRGIPHKLYVDNGSCYRAINLEQITACLGIGIKHSRPYKPQGRGKIERFFRTVRDRFLPLLPRKQLILEQINEHFFDWVEEYNNTIHSGTGNTPVDRYRKNIECVRPAPKDLIDYFRLIEFRLVKKDRTFQLKGKKFEAPPELIDRKIELKYHEESPEEIEIFFNNKSHGMANCLDKSVNANSGRKYSKPLPKKDETQIKSKTEVKSGQLFNGGMTYD